MNRNFFIIASIFGCTAVILGAFGAHTLRAMIDENSMRIYEKGVSYQFYHTFALFITAILFERTNLKSLRWAGYCFIAGVLLFSGSLYLLSMGELLGINKTIVGPITPMGGVCFIAGWICLMIGSINIYKKKI